jgi:hypothetical protein
MKCKNRVHDTIVGIYIRKKRHKEENAELELWKINSKETGLLNGKVKDQKDYDKRSGRND